MKNHWRWLSAVGFAFCAATSAHADFVGKVISVSDGDTVTVLKDRDQVKVRLSGIDAPEKAQGMPLAAPAYFRH